MKTQYRIRTQYDTFEGGVKTNPIYIPEYRNIFTLFIWSRFSIYAIYDSKEKAEVAIKLHRSKKTVKTYENFE